MAHPVECSGNYYISTLSTTINIKVSRLTPNRIPSYGLGAVLLLEEIVQWVDIPPVRSEADSEHDNTSPTWTAAMLNKKTGLSLHQLMAHYVN